MSIVGSNPACIIVLSYVELSINVNYNKTAQLHEYSVKMRWFFLFVTVGFVHFNLTHHEFVASGYRVMSELKNCYCRKLNRLFITTDLVYD